MEEDKVIAVNVENGKMIVNLKSGKKIEVDAQTIYTEYESGRKDCKINILSPLGTDSDCKQ